MWDGWLFDLVDLQDFPPLIWCDRGDKIAKRLRSAFIVKVSNRQLKECIYLNVLLGDSLKNVRFEYKGSSGKKRTAKTREVHENKSNRVLQTSWLIYLGMIWMIDQVFFSLLKVDVGLLQAVEYQAYLKII